MRYLSRPWPRSYGRTFRDSRPGVVGLPPRKDPNHSFRQRAALDLIR